MARRVCLVRSLFPHQQAMLDWAEARSRIALFAQMRLGKTPVTIRWARTDPTVLVLAPLSTLSRYGWWRELSLEAVRPIHALYDVPNKKRWEYLNAHPFRGWYLLNYEGLRVAPWLLKLPWSTIVLDESTRIRNPQAQITKLLTAGCRHIEKRAILTGLPNPESALDYFSQFQFLHGTFLRMKNFYQFRHCLYQQAGFDWVPKRGTHARIKAEVHRLAYVLSRKDVGLGNRKIREVRAVDPTPEILRFQEEIIDQFSFDGRETKWSPVQQTWLAKLAGGYTPDNHLICDAKLQELVTILQTELKRESVVVWFRFNHELHAAVERIREWTSVAWVTGKTSKPERSRIQESFQAGKVRILCMQVKCGQWGMNLSKADTAIYYSNAWDYEVRAQSEDRIEHLQKHVPLLLIDLIMRESTDVAVLEALNEKSVTAKSFSIRLVEHLHRIWARGKTDEQTSQRRTVRRAEGTTQRSHVGALPTRRPLRRDRPTSERGHSVGARNRARDEKEQPTWSGRRSHTHSGVSHSGLRTTGSGII